jgi:hypothetical protein
MAMDTREIDLYLVKHASVNVAFIGLDIGMLIGDVVGADDQGLRLEHAHTVAGVKTCEVFIPWTAIAYLYAPSADKQEAE